MADSTKKTPDPKSGGARLGGEELPTLEGPIKADPPKPAAPSLAPSKTDQRNKEQATRTPQSHPAVDASNTQDSSVALKTPITAPPVDSKQSNSALDDGATVFGGPLDTPSGIDTEGQEYRDAIGPYRLMKLLGEGGMGQVWLAQQTSPVRRKVALKLIKGGKYDQLVIQRFEAERQSLAIMDHPAIAKVFDAGSTSEGQPFFVMEYVTGAPITQYCDEKRLTTRERLQLFIKVCEGVQHAHQKAIIHRDLKPGNILVSEQDGKAAPHIIDFGIAKATEKQPDHETLVTQVGMLVGTPGYMAPEQTDASGQDVDTRADVYALGVILYEMLTGTLPFDLKQWQKQPLIEVLRQIREEDPPRPSTRFIAAADTATTSAEMRQMEPRQLAGQLKGDLDWITMKALEKDRARRYDSPSALAADVRRFLDDEPVLASPPSLAYRSTKFVKRHKVGVLAAATVFVLLIVLAVSMTVEAVRIARERDRANREAAASKSVSDFLTGLFKVSDPSEARGNTITAREILDKGAKNIETNLKGQPAVQARMMGTIGNVYDSLGLYPQAQAMLEKSLETRRRALGPAHPDTLESMNSLAHILRQEGKYSDSEVLLRQTLDMQRRVLGPEDPATVLSMVFLATTLREEGKLQECETLRRAVLEIQSRKLGPEHPDTLRAMNDLADVLAAEARYPEAEKLFGQTLEIEQRVLGPDHPETLRTAYNLAANLGIDNHLAEAEKLQKDTLATRLRVLGPDHADTLLSMDSLANILQAEGRLAEADGIRRSVLDTERRVLGPEHPWTLFAMSELANNLSVEGHYTEAEKLLEETLNIQIRVLGPDDPDTANTRYNLACNAALRNQKEEAFALLRQAMSHGLSPANRQHMEEDSDLKSLHGDPRFVALIAEVHKEAASAHKSQ